MRQVDAAGLYEHDNKSYTIEYIYALPEGKRAELTDGELYMMAAPGMMHQRAVSELHYLIKDYIKRNDGSCEVFPAPFAVFLNADDNCIECRKERGYLLKKKDIVKTIRDKDYTFGITVAVCAECGEEMSIPGLIDKNVMEIDEQYRAAEGLVSIDDIKTAIL